LIHFAAINGKTAVYIHYNAIRSVTRGKQPKS